MHASKTASALRSPSGGRARLAPHGTLHGLTLKRVRDGVAPDDGMRVLVDRLWPRGLSKDDVAADLWLRDAAPSSALRRWYGHDPRRWASFAEKYRAELAERADVLDVLDGLRRRAHVTLIYDAADAARNNAVVLHEVLSERSGPRPPARS